MQVRGGSWALPEGAGKPKSRPTDGLGIDCRVRREARRQMRRLLQQTRQEVGRREEGPGLWTDFEERSTGFRVGLSEV